MTPLGRALGEAPANSGASRRFVVNRTSMSGRDSLAQWWMAIAGIVLIAVGLIGFVQNPIAYSSDALLTVDNVHNIVHLATGALALFIAFGLRGEQQINATIGFGILYLAILVLVIVSPTMFGLFNVAANNPVHVVHGALAIVSLGVGYMARNAAVARA
jgi:hypothetical protein